MLRYDEPSVTTTVNCSIISRLICFNFIMIDQTNISDQTNDRQLFFNVSDSSLTLIWLNGLPNHLSPCKTMAYQKYRPQSGTKHNRLEIWWNRDKTQDSRSYYRSYMTQWQDFLTSIQPISFNVIERRHNVLYTDKNENVIKR